MLKKIILYCAFCSSAVFAEGLSSNLNNQLDDFDLNNAVTKLYKGDSYYQFPEKQIQKLTDWKVEKFLGCKEKNFYSDGVRYVIGKTCKKKEYRYIYYKDGFLLKEIRITEKEDGIY